MTTEKRSKTPCQTCHAIHEGRGRITSAKWRITYRDGVRFQQQADLCARHFADVLDKLTPKGRAVDLTLTKLR